MNPIVETYQHEPAKAETKAEKRANAAAQKGFDWLCRIVDARTGEVLHQSAHHYARRDYADRHGQRLIARWRKTGSWTERQGVQAAAGKQE